MKLQEDIQRIKEVMELKESSEITDNVVGKEFWFEYHCFESPDSCDAELWYRTHNKVLVLSIVEFGCGETKLERLLEGCPRVYRVVFEDGFEYDVFEDELMESKEEFERPDAPKINIQEQITRIQSMMELKESFTGETPTDIRQYFINKPVKLIGDLNTNTKIQDLIVNKDGSVNITFQNGIRLDSSIPMLTSFSVGINIPLQFKVRKKTTKLQEENSQETSGTDKSSRTQKIEMMIDKTGIINTVNTFGGYNNFIKMYNKEFTKSEKIKLICDIVDRYSWGDDSEDPLDVLEFGINLDYVESGEYGSEALIEMLDIDKNGGFLYNETEYLPEEGEYDWDNTRQGMGNLIRLSQKEIDDVFVRVIRNVN